MQKKKNQTKIKALLLAFNKSKSNPDLLKSGLCRRIVMLFVGEFCTQPLIGQQNKTLLSIKIAKNLLIKKQNQQKLELDKCFHKYLHYAIITKTVTFKFL